LLVVSRDDACVGNGPYAVYPAQEFIPFYTPQQNGMIERVVTR
jgi:hypothetical protein